MCSSLPSLDNKILVLLSVVLQKGPSDIMKLHLVLMRRGPVGFFGAFLEIKTPCVRSVKSRFKSFEV